MKKRFIKITLFLVMFVLIVVFCVPLPHYVGMVSCKPCWELTNCPPCPSEQWVLEKPLFWSVILPFFTNRSSASTETVQISPAPITGSITAGAAEVEKAELVSIARSYLKTRPSVHLEDHFVSWNKAESSVKNLDLEYFSKYNPGSVYFNLGQTELNQPLTAWEEWWVTETAGTYVVQWDPDCDKYINSETKVKCLPYFRLFVIIDKDLKPLFVDIIQIQKPE